jgi:dTDP-glucose pyrophosphorylase
MRRVEQGLILAAGRGTRLHPLSGIFPKPLHPVCNKPIMQYQVEAMRAAGIEEIAIVLGPSGGAIRAFFGTGARLGVRLHYIVDPAPSGIASSLACAEGWVRGPFAVFLGDIFLALDDIAPALEPLAGNCAGTIVVRRDTPAAVRRNFAVLTDAAGRVTRVIEKPAEPPTDLKGCGVYVFDQAIFEAIRRTPRSALRGEYEITDAVQILVDMGRPVYAADVVRWDVNITFPEDLLDCNLRVLREMRLPALVGAAAHIHSSARLASSIVGDGGQVDAPVMLEECLVLPGGRVSGIHQNARRHIFGDGLVWAAEQQRAVGG